MIAFLPIVIVFATLQRYFFKASRRERFAAKAEVSFNHSFRRCTVVQAACSGAAHPFIGGCAL
jgi:hypothetical protein